MKKQWFVGVPFAIAALVLAKAQTPEYVSVAKAAEPGEAPLLKVQLLTKADEEPREYALIFGKGDEVASGLVKFAQEYGITSAHFTGVGAFRDVTVGWMDRGRKAYKVIPIKQQVEVLTLAGDIALFNGQPAVHTHLVVERWSGEGRSPARSPRISHT